VLNQTDIKLILLRLKNEVLPDEYVSLTSRHLSYIVDVDGDMLSEIVKFKKWCLVNEVKFDHFCCMSEPRQEFWQAFARALGLPAIDKTAIHALRHKPSMKEWIKNCGLNVTPFNELSCLPDLLNFVSEHGFPLILKPVDGYGTLNTFFVDSVGEAVRIFHELKGQRIMVEKFVDHREYECCALIYRGEVLDVFPSFMPASPLNSSLGAINANISIGSDQTILPQNIDLLNTVQKLVEGFNLESGYLHMELFISQAGEIIISELALRYPGCEIAKNHGYAFGFDINAATLSLYLDERPELLYTQSRSVGDLMLPYVPGRVVEVSEAKDLLNLKGVLEVNIGVTVGEVLPFLPAASFNCSGWVIVEGKSVAEVERRMEHIRSQYVLITK
jgi:hypothetical protein